MRWPSVPARRTKRQDEFACHMSRRSIGQGRKARPDGLFSARNHISNELFTLRFVNVYIRPASTAEGGQDVANVTIKDVARVAQVSVATVSRALNGHGNVAEAVRNRVFAAARE